MKKRITNAALKAWEWIDDRTGISENVWPHITHLVPRNATWWYVFGSATLCAFIVQVVSGVALALSYIPSAGEAFTTLKYISEVAPLGNFLRGMHYWGAGMMVLMAGFHMLQVFLFGAFKFPREMTWLSGLALLALMLGMAFTGQLLRWDQNAVWSVVLAAEAVGRTPFIGEPLARFILGGDTIGGATLTRFYVVHVFVIPGMMIGLIALHMYMVMRHGISEPPVKGKRLDPKTYRKEYDEEMHKTGVPFFPDAAWRDMVFAVLVVGAIAAVAWFIGPPAIESPPDPSIIEAQPRPDWYFLWLFALMALMPDGMEAFAMVLGPVIIGSILIAVPFLFSKGERHPARRPWAVGVVIVTLISIVSLWIAGAKADWSPNFEAPPLSAEIVGTTTGPVAEGAVQFHEKSCLKCHLISDQGGRRGPNLTYVGDRLTKDQIIVRIMNGGHNMPSFAGIFKPEEMENIAAFLLSRKQNPEPEPAAATAPAAAAAPATAPAPAPVVPAASATKP